jgi:hypothetical protein
MRIFGYVVHRFASSCLVPFDGPQTDFQAAQFGSP